jgi:alanine dehydrogenase
LKGNAHLAKGLNVLAGELTHPAVAQALGKTSVDPYGAWK